MEDTTQVIVSTNIQACDPLWFGDGVLGWARWAGVRDAPMGMMRAIEDFVLAYGMRQAALVLDPVRHTTGQPVKQGGQERPFAGRRTSATIG